MAEPMKRDDAIPPPRPWPRPRRVVARRHGILLPDALYERLILGACSRGITTNEYALAILRDALGIPAAAAGQAA
jgi:hypothetical protein